MKPFQIFVLGLFGFFAIVGVIVFATFRGPNAGIEEIPVTLWGTLPTEEFVEALKEDFFSHRVFVFTPKGDVIDLPSASTPIDFAYAIHTDLGNHLQGAKVNGKLVSFDTTLNNGDVVEIVRRDSAHPSTKWLDHVRTSLARKQIRLALDMTKPDRVTHHRRPRTAKNKLHRKNTR